MDWGWLFQNFTYFQLHLFVICSEILLENTIFYKNARLKSFVDCQSSKNKTVKTVKTASKKIKSIGRSMQQNLKKNSIFNITVFIHSQYLWSLIIELSSSAGRDTPVADNFWYIVQLRPKLELFYLFIFILFNSIWTRHHFATLL